MRVSTHTLQTAMLRHATRLQGEAVTAQTEMATGRLADPGRTLGARTAGTTLIAAQLSDWREGLDANGLLRGEIGLMQTSLAGLGKAANALSSDLIAALAAPTDSALAIARDGAASALAGTVSFANARLGDVHVFGGTRTGEPPLADPREDAAARDLVANRFAAHFGHPIDYAATGAIDRDAMAGFLDALEADFPALYSAAWAGDPPDGRTARSLPGERVSVPITAHDPAVRDLVLASSLAVALADAPLGGEARKTVFERGIAIAGRAAARSAQAAGRMGAVEERFERAEAVLTQRIVLGEAARNDLVGVDPTEAAGRVQALAARIEASLAVTARISRLSLLNYL